MSADLRVETFNYSGDSAVSPGSRGYVLFREGGGERAWVLVRSRGGRWIEKWIGLDRVTNERLTTVPPEHLLYERLRYADRTATK